MSEGIFLSTEPRHEGCGESTINLCLLLFTLVYIRHYGDYCGPTPEVILRPILPLLLPLLVPLTSRLSSPLLQITPDTGCRHPLNLAALDDTDEICRLHDHFYCKCDSVYHRYG